MEEPPEADEMGWYESWIHAMIVLNVWRMVKRMFGSQILELEVPLATEVDWHLRMKV